MYKNAIIWVLQYLQFNPMFLNGPNVLPIFSRQKYILHCQQILTYQWLSDTVATGLWFFLFHLDLKQQHNIVSLSLLTWELYFVKFRSGTTVLKVSYNRLLPIIKWMKIRSLSWMLKYITFYTYYKSTPPSAKTLPTTTGLDLWLVAVTILQVS